MRYWIFLFLFYGAFGQTELPKGFVNVTELIPDIQFELRYLSTNNFIGDTISGYKNHKLIMTYEAAINLKKVHLAAQDLNLCLLVYDAYRPQQAVNQFLEWVKNASDTLMKKQFYPNIKKNKLFSLGYIASRSGHSRGSTLDLTLLDPATQKPLDMGSAYDFFGEISNTNHPHLTLEQKSNRALLVSLMNRYGFRNYPKEWWHFTLRNEPFPKTYFTFTIE